MLAKHRVEHAASGRKEFIVENLSGFPLPVGDLKDRTQKVGERFVGTEDAEIALVLIERGHVAEEPAQYERILAVHLLGEGTLSVSAEVRHSQIVEQDSAIGVRIGSHPPVALGREFGQFRQDDAASNSSSAL